ncbi:hypothetical protein VY657_004180 [Salmonella enterica]|uniref:Uncharacterized protein n=1 Tax=Salmonella arizonae (strain ATCC BAA-731 / CDC346-86 / RSK2980) TaxID=41514 RepID=A9MN01_SALAR|nr:hypothetical protein SARI_02619 [Salmonella enterica subsp. arizonae serovar 62:z4,z23:-]EAW8702144.1 hypothetical protein [Salmonella enterica]EKR1499167.1 hypothetical protein [Salmonella enterica subsp. arizonae serovar 41:z4,z23:-]HBJ6761024.1 hypothetical protein [Salmonella enterica subsp. houtenae serovar 48:g,z51:-]EHL3535015.1 hypothetical protein [Salmonella enterica]
MRYFKTLVLIFVFSTELSHAIDFKLSSSDQVGDVKYFSLRVQNDNEIKNIDVGLEGNSNNAEIKQYYSFSCQWGKAYGVRLNMDSSSIDGPLLFDNIYVLDEKLNIVFAKSYIRMSKQWVDPVSLNSAVCNRSGGDLKNDPTTKKDYIANFEAIQQGPFVLKGINDIVIKYIRDDSLNLIREDANGEVVIDTIKNHDNKSPSVRTVFFMKISSEMNVISLVSWGGDIDEGDYYKIYGYTYDETGHLRRNTTLDKDSNLSGYNTNQSSFKYKNANSIKEYLIKKYGS